MSTASQNNRKKNDDWGAWAGIVILFAMGIWPVALIWLFFKLFGSDDHKKTAQRPQQRTPAGDVRPSVLQTPASGTTAAAQAAVGAAKQTASVRVAKKMTRTPTLNTGTARTLKIVGLIAAVFGFYLALDPAEMVFAGYVANWIWDLLKYAAMGIGGLGMFFSGISMDRAIKRYQRYLAVIGESQKMTFSDLTARLGYAERRIIKDLEKMIDKGYFGSGAYINREARCFFRSVEAERAAQQEKKRAESAAAVPQEAEAGYSGILRNIRRANDQIADPMLSVKINHLEDITAKIFRVVEEDPKKRERIGTLLDYYLPTTQKLLNSYAEFESAGIEGENLRQAKARIEATMDSIIAGFEHQLDELYKEDALDVDSDIRVMETMLHRDTASVARDFGLGETGGKHTEVDLGGIAAQRPE